MVTRSRLRGGGRKTNRVTAPMPELRTRVRRRNIAPAARRQTTSCRTRRIRTFQTNRRPSVKHLVPAAPSRFGWATRVVQPVNGDSPVPLMIRTYPPNQRRPRSLPFGCGSAALSPSVVFPMTKDGHGGIWDRAPARLIRSVMCGLPARSLRAASAWRRESAIAKDSADSPVLTLAVAAIPRPPRQHHLASCPD